MPVSTKLLVLPQALQSLPQALPEPSWQGDEKSKITEKLRESMR